jgi:hypothetical protein
MKTLSAVGCGAALACGFLFLALNGISLPFDFLFNLAVGWAFYLYRVLPQVRVNGAGFATALVCLAALAFGLQWFLRWPLRRTAVVLSLIVLLFVAGIAVVGIGHQTAWLLTSPEPFVKGGLREAALHLQSQNNLKQMAFAMFNYQELEKSLPPAARCDRQGRPLLSWRVLILPYLEYQSLYQEFHLDEPWDSPHNLRLLPRMPKVYAPLDLKSAQPYCTPYQVFVDGGAAFEEKRGLHLPADFPDGTSNTLLIVEAAELVPWTKPADLPYDRHRPLPPLGRLSPHYFQGVMADGSVRKIEGTVKETTLRAAITRNGGETLGEDW